MKLSVLSFLLAFCILFIQACCWGLKCECMPEGLILTYKNVGDTCLGKQNSDLRIKSMQNGSMTLISDNPLGNIGICETNLPVEGMKTFWVIYSDSLAISDTLVILDVKLVDGKGCCACMSFEHISYRIGQDTISETSFTRVVP